MDKLKPCPKCGKDDNIQLEVWQECDKPMRFTCRACEYSPDWWENTVQIAAAYWNTRPIEDALRAELDKRKPIPVSERMPEEGQYVLIFDSHEDWWTVGRLVKLYNSRYQWTLETGIYWHDDNLARVTHWMPLPPAPEVEP